MRIHLPLHPEHFEVPIAGPSSSPLVQIGGNLVLIELQGELSWEGDRADGVVGVLGFDRPDKPTLHLGEHHLLHGKLSTLQKPYAVIRRVIGDSSEMPNGSGAVAMEGDADEEEDEEDAEAEGNADTAAATTPRKSLINGKSTKDAEDKAEEEEDEEEPPLFPPSSPPIPVTPAGKHVPSSSSPWIPSSSVKDYSSELDFSSPPRSVGSKRDRSENEDEDETPEERLKRLKLEKKREERRARRPERTRFYEVVGVVRKKVVFALRPEPIVTATVLPD